MMNRAVCALLLSLITSLAWADVLYVHTDHLGTPRLMTNEQGATVWRNLPTNEPFGNSPVEEDPDGDSTLTTLNLRFPGQYADKETNLNYNYFRDYDPATGRYVQSDPIGLAAGVNTYSYVLGNPVSYVDPLGLIEWPPRGMPPASELYSKLYPNRKSPRLIRCECKPSSAPPPPSSGDIIASSMVVGASTIGG